ncbi:MULTISPECIES: TrbI/VirB10 family protein [unclassified Candidatus Frackibacter]|uniref:TrbI/VirB10 family protein n=1 Tax=unclassified Candidatus Frackibacter TaxID=2648818 RepID=UPI000882892F|nr:MULTISPECIES: TrbI/VirB10 family protein [unclassified Candidatus Frackibacter]SDC31350.1 conjugation TrbI-like protein [Candidatus Frackibacter sp. WG11]SEM73490.1 conjugation TrbI-like protein [Candidatus Frackibacter sp. WG12]SFL59229.1 conjugation TrbI-like protein [Candidatus Frackibacter sp. WG13]
MLKDKLNSLKDLLIDEEGKPKFKAVAVLILTIIIFTVLAINLLPTKKVKKTAGILDINYNLPKPPTRPKVKINPSSKDTYLKKDELSAVLDKKLSGAFSNEAEEIIKQIDRSQRRMMIQIRKERKAKLKELKAELESKFSSQNNKSLGSNSASNISNKLDQSDQERRNDRPSNKNNSNQNQTNTKKENPTARRTYKQRREFTAPTNTYRDYSSNLDYAYSNQNKNRQAPSAIKPSSMVVVDNFNTRVGSSIVVNKTFKEPKRGYEIKRGIKAGTLVPAQLKVGLVSSEARSPALVKVTKDIKYEGEVYIPKGSLFLGYATADYGVRQMFVTLEKLIIGNREIDVKAHLVKQNGTPGFASQYIDLTMEKFWPTFLMDFAAGILQSFKDVIYVVSDNGLPQKYYQDTLKNKAIDGTTQGITKWTDRLMRDAEEHQAIIIVDPGVKGKIFIDEKILISKFKGD